MKEKNLSPRESRFVAAYTVSGDPEQAARAAGVSPARAEAAGRRLLEKPAVQRALEEVYRSRPRPRSFTEQDILWELCAIAFSDFTDYVRVEDGAVVVTDSRALDYSRRAAIAGIKDTGKGVEIKLHDKQKALELLGKHLGVWDRKPDEEDRGVRVTFEAEMEDWSE